jgi:hypothetical protein
MHVGRRASSGFSSLLLCCVITYAANVDSGHMQTWSDRLFCAVLALILFGGAYEVFRITQKNRAEEARLDLGRRQEQERAAKAQKQLFEFENTHLVQIERYVASVTTSGGPKHPTGRYLKEASASCQLIERTLGASTEHESGIDRELRAKRQILHYKFNSELLNVRSIDFECVGITKGPASLMSITRQTATGTETILHGAWFFSPR